MKNEFDLLRGVSLLIIEDNEIHCFILNKMLKPLGISAEFANNGKNAVERMQNSDFDIILMDLALPDMNGEELAKQIRSIFPESKSKIIVMSANCPDEKTINTGVFHACLTKPFSSDLLIGMLTKVVVQDRQLKTDISKSEENKTDEQHSEAGVKFTNLSFIEEIAAGDNSFIQTFIETFIKEIPVAMQELTSAAESPDWKQIAAISHKIKSSLLYAGMRKEHKIAAEVETNAKEKSNISKIREYIQNLQNSCEIACRELQQCTAI